MRPAMECCTFLWNLYKVLFWCKTLRKWIVLAVVNFLVPFFLEKVPFLANIGCCLNFLDLALMVPIQVICLLCYVDQGIISVHRYIGTPQRIGVSFESFGNVLHKSQSVSYITMLKIKILPVPLNWLLQCQSALWKHLLGWSQDYYNNLSYWL